MTLFARRALTVLFGLPLVLGWLWIAKTYDQFWLFALLLALVTAVASWEYATLIVQSQIPLEKFSLTLVSVLAILAYGVWGEGHASLILVAGGLLLLQSYLFSPEGMKSLAAAILGLFYIPYFLHFFYPLFEPERGFYYTLLVLLLVWAYDTGAYIVGSLLGKHKLVPELSPKKSWEGVFGGWMLALIAAELSWLWMPGSLPLPDAALHGLALSVLVSMFAQLGDLFESKLKRAASVKDSGAFLPGHGGMLDRIDGLLFALPIFYFYVHYVLKWV
jgi:phosphatidate cytidylyltransferase